MKIEYGKYPPNYELIKKKFNPSDEFVFTYGDTVYVPSGVKIPEHLKAHEQVHIEQQKENPDEWWDKFIKDRDFRLAQEIKAYRAEYQFFCLKEDNKRKRYNQLFRMALYLSGDAYGRMLTMPQACALIAQDV